MLAKRRSGVDNRVMFIKKLIALVFLFAALCSFAAQKKEIVVVAVEKSPDSVKLAKAYCDARGIPQSRILLLDIEEQVNISRENYNDKIARPIFDFLRSEKLIDVSGSPEKFQDALVTAVRLDHLVLCRPLPYRISATPLPDGEKLPPINDSASVDSELTLLLRGNYELKGISRNPNFGGDVKQGSHKFFSLLSVARLDGVSFEAAHNLYKTALAAERDGLRGTAVVDMGFKFKEGEAWLERAGKIVERMGFETSWEKTARLRSFRDRHDAPAFYFGWYASSAYAYFADKDFNFAPGASALHIFSFSASNLRSQTDWIGALAARGASASFGTINEPFLSGFYRPDVYAALLARGFDTGEAALCSMPTLSWKGAFLGDPLFMPFTVSLDEQIKRIDEGNVDALSQYSVIRKMNLLNFGEGADVALAFGQKYVGKLGEDFALNWKLSQCHQAAGRNEDAIKFAKVALVGAKKNFANYGLAFEILQYLDSQNLKDETVAEYMYLVDSQWKGRNRYLKDVLPALLKDVRFPDDAKSRYEARNLELNPPPKPKEEPAKN